MNHPQNNCYEEDEIDLRELLKTIIKNKKLIFIITFVITLLAAIYVYTKTPVYEAKALVEIGYYKVNNANNANNAKKMVDNASELSKKLNVIFIDLLKNKKDRKSQIENISLPKNTKNFIEIKSNAISNKLAREEIYKVVNYVQNKHQQVLNDVKKMRETQIKQTKANLKLLKDKKLPMVDKRIEAYKKNIANYDLAFNSLKINIEKLKKQNPTLAALQINELRYLTDVLIKLKEQLSNLKDKKNNLKYIKMAKLQEKLISLQTLMEPYNYKNTTIVGDIITNDYPAKPKKKLIIAVAFVTGLILSVFLVFFLEFIKSFEEDKTKNKS